MQNKPPYPITSVDHALHLAILLQQEGPLRVSDAAERIGVAPSTAHRLLAMLVYRGFAEQRPDRSYQAGDVLRPAAPSAAPVALLRQVAAPHMRDLVDRVTESVNLVVLAGTEARFVASAECAQVLRVGSRVGRTLPAHLCSGGKAILAALRPADVAALYADSADVNVPRLQRELSLVRKRGFAINDQRTEAGLTALGVVVRDSARAPVAALAIAMPSVRFHRDRVPAWVSALSTTLSAIEHDVGG
ncbi:IclR family transcriptional regulator [Kibdelosporangium phytohabitans]|uniref:Transcriptional regulator n=1 Tax=Kibdelosporangium phytohabitans TaxID=860235 RepID=A0A0N9I0Y8_9PSEU|nr:IclR family transcriptional regulator [Kibdelosporangium phytohabitans]ALG11955.1 transcriptional regulator [Kibdelosporangium phytohabitans]MBE1463413.1 DNA-binding IclR family transcriptional regulator [Kibdelosporangium phytohabitans]